MKGTIGAGVLALGLAGCITTQEMPLSPNTVRLDTNAGGFLFTGQTVPQTMRRAATLCLQGGYTHFTIAQPSSEQGSVNAGVVSSCGGGRYNAFCSASTVNAPVAHAGATVQFWHVGDLAVRSGQAFDCQEMLTRYQQ